MMVEIRVFLCGDSPGGIQGPQAVYQASWTCRQDVYVGVQGPDAALECEDTGHSSPAFQVDLPPSDTVLYLPWTTPVD